METTGTTGPEVVFGSLATLPLVVAQRLQHSRIVALWITMATTTSSISIKQIDITRQAISHHKVQSQAIPHHAGVLRCGDHKPLYWSTTGRWQPKESYSKVGWGRKGVKYCLIFCQWWNQWWIFFVFDKETLTNEFWGSGIWASLVVEIWCVRELWDGRKCMDEGHTLLEGVTEKPFSWRLLH